MAAVAATATAADTPVPNLPATIEASTSMTTAEIQNQIDEPDPPTFEEIKAAAAAKIGLDDFTANVLPALQVLSEGLKLVADSGILQNWTSADWLLGLVVLAQHKTAKHNKAPAPRLAKVAQPISRREIEELLRFVRVSDAVYADTAEQFCVEASLPADVIVRSFDGGVLAPKFMLLCDTSAQQIVLAVRGTASLLDFCTDICLTNEPFGDGQGHRGIVHSAQWLVKNVRADLERLTTQHPDFDLVVTGHSLGAGVSALAAMELRPQFPALRCIAFATPASVTETLASSCADYVTTVVNGDDCVPRFHQHSMMRLQGEVSQFDWRSTLRTMMDEDLDERKAKRDEQLKEIYEAFQQMKETHDEQMKEALARVMESPAAQHMAAQLELFRARVENVIDETTEAIQTEMAEVAKNIKEASAPMAEKLQEIKEDVDAALEEQSAKIHAGIAAIQSEIEARQRQNEALEADPEQPEQENEPTKSTTTDPSKAVSAAPVGPAQVHESLFPPGRLLYLNRLAIHEDPEQDVVELLQAAHDGFHRLVLSNNMVLDHLCGSYERSLRAAAKTIATTSEDAAQSVAASKCCHQ